MDHRFRVAAVLGAVLFALAIGVASYNMGVARGLAAGATAAATSGAAVAGAPAVPVPYGPYGPYGWYRPWGLGFFGPFVVLLFWFLIFRVIFWGGFRRRRWYSAGLYDSPAAFEEWHRRAHDRMTTPPSSPGERSA